MVLLDGLGLHTVEVHFTQPSLHLGLRRVVATHNTAEHRVDEAKLTQVVQLRVLAVAIDVQRVDRKTVRARVSKET